MDPDPPNPREDIAGVMTSRDGGDPVRILFVCNANRIRSPFAAAVARKLAAEHRLPLVVSSAGLDEGGLPAMEQMVRAARDRDIDLAGHESRQVTTEMIESSDLTVTMTGAHVVELTATYPTALTRLVTLREVAETAAVTGSPAWNAVALRDWGAQVARRPLSVLLSGALDVTDPVGRPRRVHRHTAALIEDLVAQLLVSHSAPDAG